MDWSDSEEVLELAINLREKSESFLIARTCGLLINQGIILTLTGPWIIRYIPRGGYLKVRAIFKIFGQLSFVMSPKQHIGMYLSIPSRDILSPKSKYCNWFDVRPHNDWIITLVVKLLCTVTVI